MWLSHSEADGVFLKLSHVFEQWGLDAIVNVMELFRSDQRDGCVHCPDDIFVHAQLRSQQKARHCFRNENWSVRGQVQDVECREHQACGVPEGVRIPLDELLAVQSHEKCRGLDRDEGIESHVTQAVHVGKVGAKCHELVVRVEAHAKLDVPGAGVVLSNSDGGVACSAKVLGHQICQDVIEHHATVERHALHDISVSRERTKRGE